MSLKPPPPPVKSEPGSFAWMDWYKKLYDYLNTAGSIVWSTINFTGSKLTDIAIRLHSNLQGILGTGAYHISATEATEVTALLTQTGTGAFVRATSPSLVTPALGTPSALVGTNITGTASGLTAGTVTTNANLTGEVTSVGNATTMSNAAVIAKVLTGYVSGAGLVAATDSILQAIQKLNGNDATNANLTGPITSVGNATAIASKTGAGSTFVMDTSPILVTPKSTTTIGVGNATPSASGSGISFPAIQNPSTDVNTLDDYIEGTWVPNQGSGLTVVGAFSSSGTYTKIGRQVLVIGILNGATSISAAAASPISTNLPFVANTVSVGSETNASVTASASVVIGGGSTTLYSCGTIASSASIYFTILYSV